MPSRQKDQPTPKPILKMNTHRMKTRHKKANTIEKKIRFLPLDTVNKLELKTCREEIRLRMAEDGLEAISTEENREQERANKLLWRQELAAKQARVNNQRVAPYGFFTNIVDGVKS